MILITVSLISILTARREAGFGMLIVCMPNELPNDIQDRAKGSI